MDDEREAVQWFAPDDGLCSRNDTGSSPNLRCLV